MKDEINKIINWIEMGYTRLNYKEELSLVDYIKQLQQENKKYKEEIDKAIDYVENGDLLYLASKCSIIYRNNVEVVAICDRLNELLKILKEGE